MSAPVTGFFAGMFALMLVGLSMAVSAARARSGVLIGDRGPDALLRTIRAHGNFIEFVPMGLIVMALVEAEGASVRMVAGLGAALLIGRIAHAIGMLRGVLVPRVAGMVLTYGVLVVGGVRLLSACVRF